MKITEIRYGFFEAVAGFSIVCLVCRPFEYVITALIEVKLSFSLKEWQFCDFSACCVLVENHFSVQKK